MTTGSPSTWQTSGDGNSSVSTTTPSSHADASKERTKILAAAISVHVGASVLALACVPWWLWRPKWSTRCSKGGQQYEKPEMDGQPVQQRLFEMEGDGLMETDRGNYTSHKLDSGHQDSIAAALPLVGGKATGEERTYA